MSLAWDPSPPLNLAGYIVRYGTASGQYTSSTNVGNTTNTIVGALSDGVTYYFVATAFNAAGLESLPSNQVNYSVPTNGINDAPTLDLIASRTISEDAGPQSVALSGIGTGDTNELQTLTLSATSSNPSLIPNPSVSYASPNPTGTLTFQPAANASGTATVSVTVNDGQASSNLVTRTFTVTVNPVNDAPTITAIADLTIVQGTSAGAIGFTVGDIETAAGSLTVSAASSNPALVPTTGIVLGASGANRTVTIIPASNQIGSASVTLTVSDGSAVASDTFVVTVTPPGASSSSFTNQTSITIADVGAGAPYPSPIAVSGLAGTISQVTLTLKNISHAYSEDIDVLLVGPSGQEVMVLSDAGAGTSASNVTVTLSDGAASFVTGPLASGTYRPTDVAPGEARDLFPLPAPAGPYSASLSSFNGGSPNGTWALYVNDDGAGDQGLVSGGWTLTIATTAAANSAPTLDPIASRTISEDAGPQSVALSGIGTGDTSELQTLTLSATSSNPSLIPNPSISYASPNPTGTLTFQPTANASGTATVSVTVNDGQSSSNLVTRTFDVTVNPVNDAPSITAIADQFTPANTPTAAIPFTVNDAETPAGSLVLGGASSNPVLVQGANIVFGGSGSSRTVTVTPATGQSGTSTITVTVTDGAVGSSSASFVLTVAASNPLPTIVLTSPSSGASYSAPALISLAASVTANGYPITKVQFYNGSSLLGEAASSPYSFTWSGVTAGSYAVTARVVYGAGSTAASPAVTVVVTGLPAPWQTADLGIVGMAGSASASGGIYAVSGAGNISGTTDNYRFVYQTLSGDGNITVHLDAVANSGVNGRVGVMIRESLTAGSKCAFMGVSPDGMFRWQRRRTTSGNTSSTTATVGVLPNAWVRLVRTGNTIYAYRSADGATWTLAGSRAITMAASSYIGLAVASGSSTTLNASSFSSATVAP